MLNTTIFQQYCQSLSWYRPGLKVLLACSGGIDSTVLLHLFHEIPEIQLRIVHFNHQLRDADSDADRDFVEAMAARLGYPVHVISENIGNYAAQNAMSIEEAGSIRRRSTFLALKNELGYDFIATGHHLDDQIETLLINLYQGCGIQGLAGISDTNHDFIRPLLAFSREQIIQYSLDKKLEYCTDRTNTDTSFLRNNIRANIIPGMIENNGLELRSCIKHIIEAAQALSGLIETSIEDIDNYEYSRYFVPKIALGMGQLPDYFSPIQKAIFDRAFQFISLMPQGISSSHFKAIKSLFEHQAIGREIQLPASVSACRNRKGITFYKKSDYQWSQSQLTMTNNSKFPFFNIEFTTSNFDDHIQDPSYFWYVHDLEAYSIRVIKPGDRVVIDASGRTIPVNQILQSARVAPFLKAFYPVMEYEGEILWVPGIRTAYTGMVLGNVKDRNELRHCIKIRFQKGTFE